MHPANASTDSGFEDMLSQLFMRTVVWDEEDSGGNKIVGEEVLSDSLTAAIMVIKMTVTSNSHHQNGCYK